MKLLARLVAAFVFTLALVPARSALAVGEQDGRIKGLVTDASSGIALPAMTITASSSALIGGARSVLSDEQGRYEFTGLPPGLYTVEFVYEGAAPVRRQVEVRQGATTPLNLAWTLEAAGVEKLALTDTRNLTTPDSGQTGGVLNANQLRRVPTGRGYQAAAQMMTGVSGRTNSSGGSNPNIRGGLEIHNRFLIDGLDITDPITGTFSANMNFDSIGSVQVLTGGMEAQYNSLGGVINVISQGGSNEWHANASFYLNHEKLSATGNYGAQTYHGFQPFNESKVGPNQRTEYGINIGGPILRDRLWFGATYELRLSEASPIKGPPLGAPPYDIQHAPETFTAQVLRLKLSAAPARSHRLSVTFNADPASFNNVAGAPNHLLGVAEDRQNQGGFFVVGHWDYFITQALQFNLQAGYQVNTIEYGPQGRLGTIDKTGCDKFTRKDNCTYDPSRAQHYNATDGTWWYQGSSYVNDKRNTIQVDPSLSLRVSAFGRHDAKFGVQTRVNRRTFESETPGGAQYIDGGGGPLEAGLCDPMSADGRGCNLRQDFPSYSVKESGRSIGFYAQDRWWTPLPWLTVVPGLRYDMGVTRDRQNRLVSDLKGFGPRLALVGDLTGDGRTVVSAAYGRANEVLSLLPAANKDSKDAATVITRAWNPDTKTFDGPENVVATSGGEGNVLVDKDLKTPHTDEIAVSLRRQVFNNTVVGTGYTWKRLSNQWDWKEINQVWDPSGQRVVDWVDGDRMNRRQIFLLTTPDDNVRNYHGVDLFAEGEPTPNWYFNTSYTLAWLFGPGSTSFDQIQPFGQFSNPRNYRYFDGYLPEDVRHTLKAFGAYQWGPVNLGFNLRYETGPPRTKRFYSPIDGAYYRYRSPQGTDPGAGNDAKQISELRIPDFFQADLRLIVNLLPPSWQSDLTFITDVFNVFGTRRPTAIAVNDIPATYGTASGRQRPLRVQFALNFAY